MNPNRFHRARGGRPRELSFRPYYIESLYALTGEISLSMRRIQLMIQYYIRCLAGYKMFYKTFGLLEDISLT